MSKGHTSDEKLNRQRESMSWDMVRYIAFISKALEFTQRLTPASIEGSTNDFFSDPRA
jgi:hypothetical protein